MMSFLQEILNPECLLCGSLLRRSHLFCHSCFADRIFLEMRMKEQTLRLNDQDIRHSYLFNWVDTEERLFYRLSHQMKTIKGATALQFYTRQLLQQINLKNEIKSELSNKITILPAPGSTLFSLHSEFIADEVFRCFVEKQGSEKINRLQGLYKAQNQTQKSADRAQRKAVNIKVRPDRKARVCELITDLKKQNGLLVVVDDVLTTGSTLEACLKAIGWSGPTWVISLFYRSRVLQ